MIQYTQYMETLISDTAIKGEVKVKSQIAGKCLLKELIEDRIKAPSETKISLFDTILLKNIATGLK